MKHFLSLAVLLLLPFVLPADRIAIVTGTYDREYKIIAANKDWTVERILCKDLAAGAKRFSDFELIINGTGSGDKMPCDWEAVAPEMKEYLKNGGTLLLVTACSPRALHRVIHHFGKDFQVRYGRCCTDKDIQRITRRVWDPALSVNFFPNRLEETFANLPLWLHHTQPEGWVSMAECGDGMPVMLYRKFGKGLIFTTTYFDFGNGRQAAFRAYIENILAASKLNRMGVELKTFEYGRSYGKNVLKSTLSLPGSDRKATFTWTVSQDGKILGGQTIDSGRNGTYDFSVPYEVSSAKPLLFTLTVRMQNHEIHLKSFKEVEVPVTFLPWRDEVYPLIAGTFPVEFSTASVFSDVEKYQVVLYAGDQEVKMKKIRENLYHCDLSFLNAGEYCLRAVLRCRNSGKQLFEIKAPLVVFKRNPLNCVGMDNILRLDGRKVFPLGFYHITWKTSDEARLSAVDFVSKAGKDILLFSQRRPEGDPDFETFINYASRRGVKVRLGGPPPKKNYPAVIGYAVSDEPDSRGEAKAVLMKKRRDLRKKHFDSFSTVVIMTRSGFTDGYLRCADLVGHDPYPLPKAPISMVYYNMRELVKMLEGTSHLPFAVPQAFGYEGDAFFRTPTPEEIRNMTYQALAAGVRGIFFYTYTDSRFDLNKHPALRDEMLKLVKEIRSLEEFFINGDFAEISTGEKEIFGASWNLKGEKLEILVNATREKGVVSGNGKEISLAPLEVKVIREKK